MCFQHKAGLKATRAMFHACSAFQLLNAGKEDTVSRSYGGLISKAYN